MIVVHGLWSQQNRLCLWGEDGSLRETRPPRPSKAKVPRRKPHSFALNHAALIRASGLSGGEPGQITLLLPTISRGPQASPELVASHEPGEPLRLAPWTVPAVFVDAHDWISLLIRLGGNGIEPPVATNGESAPKIGASLKFLAEVIKLSLEFLARGRIFPGLMSDPAGDGFVARWRPVTTGAGDAERLLLLAQTMPGVCRAEVTDNRGEGQGSTRLVGQMVSSVVDAYARQTLEIGRGIPKRRGRRPKNTPPAESLIDALARAEPRVEGEPADLERFRKDLDEWASLAVAPRGKLRTCFRLSAPREDDSGWLLDFLIQVVDDPSLLFTAAEIWRGKGTKGLGNGEVPEERLLADLARAMRLYPEIEAGLRSPRPEAIELDVKGAHRFLRQAAPILEEAGFGVLVPPWWRRPSARLGARLIVRPKGGVSSGLFKAEALVSYQWEVALGEEKLSLQELRELAAAKVPLVQVRGEWVEIKKGEIEAALKFFESGNEAGDLSVAETLRASIGLDSPIEGIPLTGVETNGWMEDLFNGGDRNFASIKVPPSFRGKLRPYQKRGLSWLWFLDRLALGACLADDMGLGKTIQMLALLLAERGTGVKRAKPTLIVCPMSVVENWRREAARFAPQLAVLVHHGSDRKSGRPFAAACARSDVVVTTYGLATRDRDLLASVEWGRVVLDEAQNIKNSAAKQSQAARSLPAKRRVALTGTPVENRLSELWSIMEFLNPGLLGGATEFREQFSVPIERFRDDEAASRLKQITRPFILRRLKTDRKIIRDLPEKIEMKVLCNLTREQGSLYQAVVDDMMAKIEESEGIERKGLVLATMTKLKQVCNHPAQLLKDRSGVKGRSGKLIRLEEILEEILAEGDRALCFTQYAAMGTMLRGHLQERHGSEVLFLHGGTPRKARDEMVNRFQQPGGPSLFIISLKAGGTGLNLTAANQVIHFDRWWNPAVENQATDRAFRIGQRRNVQVRKFICVGTLEERIDQLLESKRDLADRIVGAGESWLTELSTEEIKQIVTLSKDAVAER